MFNWLGKNQHVVPYKKGWAVKGAVNGRATKVTKTKEEAMEHARIIATSQYSELIEHGKNGKIISKDSCGHDPCPPRDKEH